MRSREKEVEVERQEGTKPLGLEWSLFFLILTGLRGKEGDLWDWGCQEIKEGRGMRKDRDRKPKARGINE